MAQARSRRVFEMADDALPNVAAKTRTNMDGLVRPRVDASVVKFLGKLCGRLRVVSLYRDCHPAVVARGVRREPHAGEARVELVSGHVEDVVVVLRESNPCVTTWDSRLVVGALDFGVHRLAFDPRGALFIVDLVPAGIRARALSVQEPT